MRFHQDAIALKPAAIILWPGFCDDVQPDQRMSVIDIESHMARIARLAKGSGIRLAIGSIIPGAHSADSQNPISKKDIRNLNKWLEKLCKENDYVYIDFYKKLVGNENRLKKEYSRDGVHLEVEAYTALQPMLMRAIKELTRPTQK
jgi:lysophospholipase L1-like esterase